MNMMRSALWLVVAIFVAASPVLALAQSSYPTMPVAGALTTAGALSPWEIAAAVRRAGFHPISRPVQRGHVYLLRAVDQDNVDVRLTVDAGTGRVLWIGGAAATPYGPDYYGGYRTSPPYDRPPVPPAAVPNTGPGRMSFGPLKNTASIQRSPPLPRNRPADLTRAAAKQRAPVAQDEPKATAPNRSDVLPPPATPQAQPAMVPVAPLE